MTMTHREIIGGDGLIDLDAALVPAPLFSSPTSSASTPRAIPQPTRVTPAIPTFVPFTKEELKAKVTEDRIKARIAMLEKGESSGGAMASDRKLKGEYAATTRAVGGKKGKGKGVKAPRECRGVGECEDALCNHNHATASTQDQETRERRLKLVGLLVAAAQKQGYAISTNYALTALIKNKEKLLDALAWAKDDIVKREETLKSSGRINWLKEMVIHDMQKKLTETPGSSHLETRDQRVRFLEEDERYIKEITEKKWNSTYAQSLIAEHPNSEEDRLRIFNAYLFEAHFRESRSKYYFGLKNQGIVAEALDKFMEQWDSENDDQNYVIHSMKTTGTGEDLPPYNARREQENSFMGRLPAYSGRHGSGEASSSRSSSGVMAGAVPLPEPLDRLQVLEDAQALAAAEERGARIDLGESAEVIDFLNDPRGAEIIFRKLDAHEMVLFEKFEFVKWLFKQDGLGFKAKERLTKQAKLYLEHVRAIHYKDYDLVEKLVDGSLIVTLVRKNQPGKPSPGQKANTAGEQTGESSQTSGSPTGKHTSEFGTDPDTAPPFHLGISKLEFQSACDEVCAEKQHETTYRELRVGGPDPAPLIFPFPKAALPKNSQTNLAKMDSSSVYSEKGKGKESDTGLAKAMMSVVVDAKKVTTTPQVGAPKRTSQSLFQRLMKGKYEPAIASQSSSATPTSNPQNSSPKFFFKPKYIPGNGSSSSAPPKYKPDERQQGLKSKFKEMVVDEDGEAIIGEFHDVSDNEDDEYDSSDDDSSDDGTDAGDEANFDPDETAVEGTAEQQEIILTDADRQEAMLRYNYIQPEADEQETSAALEMAEVVNKLSHNIRGFYFSMLQQHVLFGGGKLFSGPYSPDTIAKFFTLLEVPPIEGIKVRTVAELLGLCGNNPARAHALFESLRDHLDIFYIREDIANPDFPMYEKEMLKFCNFVWRRCYILAKAHAE